MGDHERRIRAEEEGGHCPLARRHATAGISAAACWNNTVGISGSSVFGQRKRLKQPLSLLPG